MIYVLIFVLVGSEKAASMTAEFNSLGACQAAATAIRKRLASQPYYQPDVLVCAAKGEAK